VGVAVRTILRAGRPASVVAGATGVLIVVLAVANVPLDFLSDQPRSVPADVLGVAVAGGGAALAALIAARRPRNPIGWMLLAVVFLPNPPAGQYAVLDYRMHHGTLPFGWLAVALKADPPFWLVLIAILLWLFPDGRLASGRWRPVAVVLVAAGVFLALAAWASGIAAVAGHAIPVDASGNLIASPAKGSVGDTFQTIAFLYVLVSWVAWLAVQVPRYRRSAGERRQQLKWLYIGAVVFVIAVLAPAGPGSSAVVYALDVLGIAVLPVCMGVAVLRYRLYEIDRIISRVISYAIITAVLAGVFAGLVVLATVVLPFKSSVAVAASTLVVAALFNPLRKRVQHTVDRRFNRARYNAETIVAAFTARLRQTVDLDTVRGDLARVVHEAFQPAHVSVWLPGAGTQPAVPKHASARHSAPEDSP
jgi:hypothetical protein